MHTRPATTWTLYLSISDFISGKPRFLRRYSTSVGDGLRWGRQVGHRDRGAAKGTELCMRAPRAGCGPLLLWRYDGRMGRYQAAEKMARGLTGDDLEILCALDLDTVG